MARVVAITTGAGGRAEAKGETPGLRSREGHEVIRPRVKTGGAGHRPTQEAKGETRPFYTFYIYIWHWQSNHVFSEEVGLKWVQSPDEQTSIWIHSVLSITWRTLAMIIAKLNSRKPCPKNKLRWEIPRQCLSCLHDLEIISLSLFGCDRKILIHSFRRFNLISNTAKCIWKSILVILSVFSMFFTHIYLSTFWYYFCF